MKKILVLCSANSCRSQMAEGYLKFFAGEKALVFSAGIISEGVHNLAIKVMADDNIDISENDSKSIDAFAGTHFDYLITVCNAANQKVSGTISYDHHLHFDIPDPAKVEGSEEERLTAFRKTREIVKKRMLKFIGQVFSSQLVEVSS